MSIVKEVQGEVQKSKKKKQNKPEFFRSADGNIP